MTKTKEGVIENLQNRTVCHHCRRTGHVRKECRDKKRGQPRVRKSTPLELIDFVECNFCARRGHLTVNCRLRREALERQTRELEKDEKFWSDSPPDERWRRDTELNPLTEVET
jgi:hypothetical protein